MTEALTLNQRVWATKGEIILLRDAANQEDADELADLILSRPYKSDAVLDELEKYRDLMERQCCLPSHNQWKIKIKGLRSQQKERER